MKYIIAMYFLQLSFPTYQPEQQMGLFKYENRQKMYNQGVWTELEVKIYFLRHSELIPFSFYLFENALKP